MYETLETLLPPVFGLAAVLYRALAVFVLRSSPSRVIGFFLFLMKDCCGSSAELCDPIAASLAR